MGFWGVGICLMRSLLNDLSRRGEFGRIYDIIKDEFFAVILRLELRARLK